MIASRPPRFAFVGPGNMARAIAAGMLEKQFFAAAAPLVCGRSRERLEDFEKKFGAQAASIEEVAERGDVVFFAVKPKDAEQALELWKNQKRERQGVLVSVIAGLPLARLQELAGSQWRVLRGMPNTAVEIGEGVTAFCSENAREEDWLLLESIFSRLGKFLRLSESQMDALTAASGSGIAFFLAMIEQMVAAAVQEGLSEEEALAAVSQSAVGAGRLCQMVARSPRELREAVTSPNGTTAAGLEAMRKRDFSAAIRAAIQAASKRSKELSRL
ncbi:MAG: pyrroline-5-carboxylate reductase [Chthoniobacterales bacterium]